MKLACLSAGRMLEQRQSGLSAADGLKLEEHLATCASCRADANLLHELARLTAEMPAVLTETARQRAIAGAFAAHAEPRTKLTAQRNHRRGLLLVAAVAALAGAWVVARVAVPVPLTQGAPERRDSSQPSPEQLARSAQLEAERSSDEYRVHGQLGDRVLSGSLEFSGKSLGSGEPLRDHMLLRTAEGALIALAQAQIELHANSEISWDAGARKLTLPRGSALIEVDPTRHQSFEVETQAFTVSVLGTRFEVTQSSVDVLRGRVSVQPKAGSHDETALVLAADSSHTHFELPPSAAAATSPALERGTAHGRAQNKARQQQLAQESDASAWLDRARAQLAARQLKQARSTLKLAQPLLRDDASRAQALSLEAECELQALSFSGARDTYLRVAQKYPALPAAETALFAAARIEADHGQAQRAMELLTSYLSRHPQGSFAREAALRRAQLQHAAAAEPAQ